LLLDGQPADRRGERGASMVMAAVAVERLVTGS
jgi:hypothetical protein